MNYKIPEKLFKAVERTAVFIDSLTEPEEQNFETVYSFMKKNDICSGLTEYTKLLILLGLYFPEQYRKVRR